MGRNQVPFPSSVKDPDLLNPAPVPDDQKLKKKIQLEFFLIKNVNILIRRPP